MKHGAVLRAGLWSQPSSYTTELVHCGPIQDMLVAVPAGHWKNIEFITNHLTVVTRLKYIEINGKMP